MDLKQLEYFVHVVELGSFTRASNVLNIAQPALSRQVRQLEVELRQNLLCRNGRGVTATEAGLLLLEHGRGILHQVARAKEDLGRIRGALAGRVNVGLPPSASKMLTVPLTRAFRQRLPNATLSISEGLSTSMHEWLLTGQLDIALLYNPALTTELEITPLAEEALYFVGPRSDDAVALPITLSEIAGHALVIPNRPNAIRMLLETEMASLGCKPLIHLEIDSVAAILDLVADGAGFAILTKYAVTTSAHPDAYLMRPIVAPQLLTRLTMATAAGRITTLTQNAMISLIKEIAGQVYAH
ncbi:LysR substrate-binding domain-containing protein [Undibacterium griseum]|uniref:LysR family transcriptional regulator n=1 Tax=Undibacterium griseum TaxID=2762295 RepID=A0ABR6YN28_9BURK|nr:LysR substrate-binding domain-containing protein [Undibacterium griseum]MBC3885284.1 LysR family transcriptional regulator [Undibacterium griseum]